MPLLYHSLVVHFPIALWITSALFDLQYARAGERFHFRAAQYLIGLGLLAAVVSIVSGFVDYFPLVREGIGQTFIAKHRSHSMIAYAATAAYALSFYARWTRPQIGRGPILLLMLAGALLIAATGWIGGELRMVM